MRVCVLCIRTSTGRRDITFIFLGRRVGLISVWSVWLDSHLVLHSDCSCGLEDKALGWKVWKLSMHVPECTLVADGCVYWSTIGVGAGAPTVVVCCRLFRFVKIVAACRLLFIQGLPLVLQVQQVHGRYNASIKRSASATEVAFGTTGRACKF
jgi:hypothetical protein